ncbi:peroxidase [Oxalobacteraceae bacterium OM1]|nr:peroxidase [Oxalobacteraceae bacterium OM1]
MTVAQPFSQERTMNPPLTRMLAAAGLSMMLDGASAQTVQAPSPQAPVAPGNVFTRMFPDLPAFAEQSDGVRDLMRRFAAQHGMLDADDNLSDPIQSILKPAVFSPHNPDNPNMTAGITFLGQFLDHDLTFDKNSQLNVAASPEATTNFRTSALDLDTVYGKGPSGSPELYAFGERTIKFRVQVIPGSEQASKDGVVRFDVPRDAAGNAVLGDTRNDENVIISQLHLAFLLFHNAITDHLVEQSDYANASAADIFDEARRIAIWHYQWIVLHEFLPLVIGQKRLDRILEHGPRYYRVDRATKQGGSDNSGPRVPVEFSIGAYRFGHSQARPSYRLNFGPLGGAPFFAFLFDDNIDPNATDPDDLRGGKRAPRRFVDWQTFFDFGDGNVRSNKRIDGKISSVLMALPGARAPAPGLPPDGLQSLPARTLTRHVDFGLPSGQAIAEKMHMPVLDADQLHDVAHLSLDNRHTMDKSTPLFYYVLKEAEVMEDGLRLGPVGAQVVGEVFVGILEADRASYLSRKPDWKPSLPSAKKGSFTMRDLLNFAGVVHPV